MGLRMNCGCRVAFPRKRPGENRGRFCLDMRKSRWLWSADGLASRSRYILQHRNPGNVSPDNPAAPEVPVTGIRATSQRRIRTALRTEGAGKGSEARTQSVEAEWAFITSKTA